VTVDILEEMICDPIIAKPGAAAANEGVAFQLNCVSLKGSTVVWQQYIFVLWWKTQDLRWWVNNWPAEGPAVINAGTLISVLPTNLPAVYSSVPAGFKLGIELGNDADANIDSVTFTVTSPAGLVVAKDNVSLLTLTDRANLAPIVGIGMFIVGYANREYTTLSRGGGTITYQAANNLTPINVYPPCGENAWGTAESSNVTYGELDSASSQSIVQTFGYAPVRQRVPPIWHNGPRP
jgi:hypothetical protein